MKNRVPILSWPWAALCVCVTAGPVCEAAPPPEPTYWQDVRPLLRKRCTVCHSARNVSEVDVSGGLALDSYEAVLKGGKTPVVKVGDSGASLVVRLILSTDDSRRMPRDAAPLPADSIALVRRWIDGGAREGRKPDNTAAAALTPRHVRKRDVALPTNAVPPANLLGAGSPDRLQLALPVGPLAPVTAVAFSLDGKRLAVGTYGHATVWDLDAARPVKVLTNVLGAVHDVRFSPDGSLLAVAGGQPSARGDLRLYRVADWKLVATLGGHADVVFSVAFSPDGKHLASAGFDKTVRLWEVAAHRLEKTFTGHADFVYAVAFSPDGKWLASAGKDRTVKLVDAGTGKGLLTFSGMEQDVLAVAIRPDGRQVVSSGFDSGLHWWDARTGRQIRAQPGHGVAVHELAFSKDGKLLASAGADQTVRLWAGDTGAPLRQLTVGSVVYAVAVRPDGKRVASGSFDGLVRLWDPAVGRHLVTLLAVPGSDGLDWLALTPEGYASGSKGLAALGRWRMAGRAVPAPVVWKALRQPARVTAAVRGQPLPAPIFGK